MIYSVAVKSHCTLYCHFLFSLFESKLLNLKLFDLSWLFYSKYATFSSIITIRIRSSDWSKTIGINSIGYYRDTTHGTIAKNPVLYPATLYNILE